MMNRERTLLLSGILVFFGILTIVFIWWRFNFRTTHFQVGSVPQELINQLTPKTIAIESMHPPAIRITDPMRYGGATSVISIIEYGDFQCEFCRKLAPELKRVLETYKGQVRFVWRDFPIEELHDRAIPAAIFARCAGQQDRFWQAYDELMTGGDLNEAQFKKIATKIGLNSAALAACRKDPAVESSIRKDVEEAKSDGVQSAPFLFIGTKAIDTYVEASVITDAIEASRESL